MDVANNRAIKNTAYSQDFYLHLYRHDPDFQTVRKGYCLGVSTADIINFLHKKDKPYPLSNFKDAKEAARDSVTLNHDGDIAKDKIIKSGNVLTLKENISSYRPSKEEISKFISDEFKQCQDLSIKNRAVLGEYARCAKIMFVHFNHLSQHAISLKITGNHCIYADSNSLPSAHGQWEGDCDIVSEYAATSFLTMYGHRQPRALQTYTFVKQPEKTVEFHPWF